MKKSYIKLLLLQFFMVLVIAFSVFYFNIFTNNIFYALFVIASFFISYLLVGLERENKVFSLDVIRKVFVYTVVYLMLIYILGFIVGFVRNPYSLEILKIFSNVLPLVIIIIFEELLRFNIVKKLEQKKSLIVIATIIFISFDIIRSIGLYSFETGMEVFEIIGILVLASIARNSLFSYLAYKGYYKVNILYKVLITLNVYFIPIYPDLGIYLESIFSIILPTLVYMSVNSLFCKQKLIFKKEIKFTKFLAYVPVTAFLLTTIFLTSGLFRYYTMSVASGSMYPKIKVGDAIIVEKIELDKIKLGDILVHRHDGRVILHRIIKVVEKSDETCYYTKGDANNAEDGYEICSEDIYGIVTATIPYVGWPSVWIERLKK